MAPRVQASVSPARRNRDMDMDRDSSPDPLNASVNSHQKPAAKRTRESSGALKSSPRKQKRARSSSEQTVEMTSPQKSMIMSTPRKDGQSPWRIRVTVQAEPGSSDAENNNSPTPSAKRIERRMTTTVPLKDHDPSSPVKRPVGRPRKTEGTTPKRVSTPSKKRAYSRQKKSPTKANVVADAAIVPQPADAPPKRQRGRPRKVQPQENQEPDLYIEAAAATPEPVSEPTEQTSVPVTETTDASSREMPPPPRPETRKPISFGTPQKKRVKGRKGTPHAKVVAPQHDSSDEYEGVAAPDDSDSSSDDTETLEARLEALRKGDGNDNETADVNSNSSDGADNGMADDTMFESEHFTMISMDSLPSVVGNANLRSSLNKSNLNIPPSAVRKSPQATTSSLGRLQTEKLTSKVHKEPLVTPAMENHDPLNPPTLIPAQSRHSAVETPRIGQVAKAGAALQDVVYSDRVTPVVPQDQRVRQDDIFAGFSEGTRRDLQARLRLGEQLAMQQDGQSSRLSSPTVSNTLKPPTETGHVFPPQNKKPNRLITPDDPVDNELSAPPAPPPQAPEVRYPSLPVNEQNTGYLVSPAESEQDEMVWRVDDPAVRLEASHTGAMITASNEQGGQIRAAEILVETRETPTGRIVTAVEEQGVGISGPEIYVVADEEHNEDYPDIWQEEASRSSSSHVEQTAPATQKEKSSQLEDLFANDGPVKPARGKLPRTWRRNGTGDFQYSDEAEEPSQEPTPKGLDKGKGKMVEPSVVEDVHSESDYGLRSDDTGIFFDGNLSSANKGSRKRKSDGLSDRNLLNVGQDLLPESSPVASARPEKRLRPSPPVVGRVTTPELESSPPAPGNQENVQEDSVMEDSEDGHANSSPTPQTQTSLLSKLNPFKNPPPRFGALYSSPTKSSPLRQEYRASDSEGSFQQDTRVEESTLPVSSSFATNVDMTGVSNASSQFRREMGGVTDPSIRNLREEADARAAAYGDQHHTLHEIEEVTEQSRTTHSQMPSSPPGVNTGRPLDEPVSPVSSVELSSQSESEGSATEEDNESEPPEPSVLEPRRAYAPLFGPKHAVPLRQPTPQTRPQDQEPPQAPTAGLFSRLASSLRGVLVSRRPPLHPVITKLKLDPLPKTEPWTWAHFMELNELWKWSDRHPSDFALSTTSTPNINDTLLADFRKSTGKDYLDARYTCWGYDVVITPRLLTVAAVFMQLVTLTDAAEYKRVTGRDIEVGNTDHIVPGGVINGNEALRRLAVVVMGEDLRADEDDGIEIVREGGLMREWPSGEIDNGL